MSRPYRRYDKSHSEDDHYHSHHYMSDEQRAELRDIFSALAMQSLMNQGTPVPKWVAAQAYIYADAMLEARNSSVSEKPID